MVNIKLPNTKPFIDPVERSERALGSDQKSPETNIPFITQNEAHSDHTRNEFSVFSHNDHKENEIIPREINQLKEIIKKEVDALKKANTSVIAQINEIEKHAMSTNASKDGIYHVRFLETLLSMLKLLRVKVSEAGTWLTAIRSRKEKRGGTYSARSKKAGTSFTQSQELSNARSVQ